MVLVPLVKLVLEDQLALLVQLDLLARLASLVQWAQPEDQDRRGQRDTRALVGRLVAQERQGDRVTQVLLALPANKEEPVRPDSLDVQERQEQRVLPEETEHLA